jgi:hypothetical protein
MWLWNTKQHVTLDVGYRVNGFFPFENEEQFGPVADRLAAGALEKVGEYRRLFRSIHDVSNYYFVNAPRRFLALLRRGYRTLPCWATGGQYTSPRRLS